MYVNNGNEGKVPFNARIIQEFSLDVVQRRIDQRMNLPKQLLPMCKTIICLSRAWEKKTGRMLFSINKMIGKRDHGYFRRHI